MTTPRRYLPEGEITLRSGVAKRAPSTQLIRPPLPQAANGSDDTAAFFEPTSRLTYFGVVSNRVA